MDKSIFSGLKYLTHLSLQNNKLKIISPYLFAQNTEILWLRLGENQIIDDVENTIQILTKLKTLALEENNLINFYNYPESVKELFIQKNQLKKLFINKNVEILNADQNQITQIDGTDLSKLKDLSLSNNKLTHLNVLTSSRAVSLQHLWVDSNDIEELGTFAKLTSLQIIFIEYNKLKNLDESTFSGLRNLSALSLKGNELKAISPNIFSQNTEINWLSFREYQLTDDVQYAIQHLNKLQQLDLNSNKLTKFNNYPESVRELFVVKNQLTKLFINKNVEKLNAEQNQITQIDGNDFSNLKELVLDNNKLKNLKSSTFNEAKHLEHLWLNSNEIEELSTGIFSKLTKLKTLTLFDNKIKDLNESVFSSLTHLNHLNLKANKLSFITPNLFLEKKARSGIKQINKIR